MDEVILMEADESWPRRFESEAAALRQWLPDDLIVAIDHIGSTAIAGMPAKPIIDILLTVPDLAQARARAVPLLAPQGYLYWSENPRTDRLFFVKGLPPHALARTHHLHVTEPGGEAVQMIAFRDYLRRHPAEAARYAELKRELARSHRTDREAYTDAKGAFVAAILGHRGGG